MTVIFGDLRHPYARECRSRRHVPYNNGNPKKRRERERERKTEAREHGRRRCVHDLVVQRVTMKEIEEEEEGEGEKKKTRDGATAI